MDYVNYHVEVTPDQQWVRITVRHPDGTEAGQRRGRFGLAQVRDQIVAGAEAAAQDTASPEDIKRLGEALFGALFFDSAIGEHFRSTFSTACKQNQRLRFELDFDEVHTPEVAALPWEFIRAPEDPVSPGFFLATEPNLVLSRRRSLWEPPRRVAKSGPWRILLAVAAPDDPELGPVLYQPMLEELRALTGQPGAGFDPLADPLLAADLVKLDEALRSQPDILHFIGHGRFIEGPDHPHGELAMVGPGGWTEWQRDEDFGSLLERHVPAVVLLQACEGGALSSGQGLTGVASKVVQQNAPVVVAMQYPISNAAALVFARKFYERLAAGDPVDKAAQEGRRALWFKYTGRREFATPVLFMRAPDGRIFDVERLSTPMRPSATGLPIEGESHAQSWVERFKLYFHKARWRRIAGLGLLVFLLTVLVRLGQNGLSGVATVTPEGSRSAAATATLWPSPTPNLPDKLRILSADFVGCPNQQNFAEPLGSALDGLPTDGRTITIERTGQISDESAAQARGEAAQAQLVIWGACRGETVQLQVTFLELPEFYELLFEPETLQLDDRRENAQQFAIASSLYAYAQYQTAEDALSLLLANYREGTLGPVALYWLKANTAAHSDDWPQAITAYQRAISTTQTVSAQAVLYANLGLARLQAALSIPADRFQYCSQDPIGTYSTAIDLAKDQPSRKDIIPLLYVGRGLTYLDCLPSGVDDKTMLEQLQGDAEQGMASGSSLAYDLRSRIKEIMGDRLGAQSDACRALSLDQKQSVPHRTLAEVFALYGNLAERARAELEMYGRLARFNWQREEARRRLEDLPTVQLEAAQAPLGLGQCETIP